MMGRLIWRGGRGGRAQPRGPLRQIGSLMLETLIALPILLVMGLSVVQWALVHEARAFVDHGALMAARAGALENARLGPMRQALARALTPLRAPDSSVAAFETAVRARALPEVMTHARLRLLNPTREAFDDHGRRGENGRPYLPFRDMQHRSRTPGARSGLSIQEATLLRVQVTYGFPLKVPYAGWFIAKAALGGSWLGSGWGAREQLMLRANRLPIVATATVRMQSRAVAGDHFPAKKALPDVPRHRES